MDTHGTPYGTLIPLPSLTAEGKVCEHHKMGLPFGSRYCLEENTRLFFCSFNYINTQRKKQNKIVISVEFVVQTSHCLGGEKRNILQMS